ncbi:hypothetical protein [Catenulispora pinistramenti]|uniref:Mom family adenine methylcarbamoylation protein n=1 Tax=Catenulispora pinistramenti TaxID=2705254 RepID=UPI001BACF4BE|nr:hypothetical protein [Catenulispora pinistramenti]
MVLPEGWCQRWRHGRHSFVPRSAGGFRSEHYSVEPVDVATARGFVATHHYAASWVVDRYRLGLFHTAGGTPNLIGVAVFGIPMSKKVLTNPLPDWEPYVQTLELSRFVILGDPQHPGATPGVAPANIESWFLARCFEHLAARDVRGIVAFSDPIPRTVGDRMVMPGHAGIIYQASNAVYTGQGTARTVIMLPDGTSLPARAVSKIRRAERGHTAVERRLIALGAPARIGPDPGAWIRDALVSIGATPIAHPGNHRFVMATAARFRRRMRIALPAMPYPKPTCLPGAPWCRGRP